MRITTYAQNLENVLWRVLGHVQADLKARFERELQTARELAECCLRDLDHGQARGAELHALFRHEQTRADDQGALYRQLMEHYSEHLLSSETLGQAHAHADEHLRSEAHPEPYSERERCARCDFAPAPNRA